MLAGHSRRRPRRRACSSHLLDFQTVRHDEGHETRPNIFRTRILPDAAEQGSRIRISFAPGTLWPSHIARRSPGRGASYAPYMTPGRSAPPAIDEKEYARKKLTGGIPSSTVCQSEAAEVELRRAVRQPSSGLHPGSSWTLFEPT